MLNLSEALLCFYLVPLQVLRYLKEISRPVGIDSRRPKGLKFMVIDLYLSDHILPGGSSNTSFHRDIFRMLLVVSRTL